MTTAKLIRWSGLPAIVCGVITAVFWVLHPGAADPGAPHDAAFWAAMQTPTYMAVNGSFILVLVTCLFGTIGIYGCQLERVGGLGFAGFVLGFTGTAIFIGAGVFSAFVAPVLATSESMHVLLEPTGPLFHGPLAGLLGGGGVSFAIGFVLLGIATFRAKVLPPIAGILLVVSSPVLGLSPAMPFLARLIGSAIFGIAFTWLGLALWRRPAATRTGS